MSRSQRDLQSTVENIVENEKYHKMVRDRIEIDRLRDVKKLLKKLVEIGDLTGCRTPDTKILITAEKVLHRLLNNYNDNSNPVL